jgi:hypothetical protein
MALTFRRFVLALSLLAFVPATAPAAPVGLTADFLNSTLTFGGPSFTHEGLDPYNLHVYDVDLLDFGSGTWHESATFFSAGGGTLVSHTSAGFEYQGGNFAINFQLQDSASNWLFGTFTAPIISLNIAAAEPLDIDTRVHLTYVLGAGTFDSAFAAALGVPNKTGESSIYNFADLYIKDWFSTPPEHDADDGASSFDFLPAPVPEPALSVLVGLGLAAAVRARRKQA